MSAVTISPSGSDLGSTLGFLLLRVWLGVRAIITGVEKFAGTKAGSTPVMVDGEANTVGLTSGESVKVYGFDQYQGIPSSMYGKFLEEPMIPKFALVIYDLSLGPILILLGLTLLLGVATRVSLFAMGLLYTSLTVGLILLKQDAGIVWLGIHVLMIAYALFQVRHNRWELFPKF